MNIDASKLLLGQFDMTFGAMFAFRLGGGRGGLGILGIAAAGEGKRAGHQ